MSTIPCYCTSGKSFTNCCFPYLSGKKKAPTAQALMRSRFSAFASQNASYLVSTTHLSTRLDYSETDILEWSIINNWLKLEVLQVTDTTVKFKAYYIDSKGNHQVHKEFSTFKKEPDGWFYVSGKFF